MSITVGDLAKVEWWDASGCDERFTWHEPGDVAPLLLTSLGHVVAISEEAITLAMDTWMGRERRYGRNWLTIPARCLVSVCQLREAPELQAQGGEG